MENNMNRPVEILLVEDNPGDVRLTQEAFNEGKIKNNLHIVGDGIEALKFLRNEGDYANAPRPDLVLLDLNMPRMGGREVLENMKADTETENTIVSELKQFLKPSAGETLTLC